MPNGLLDQSSLRAHPEGLALSLTLPWYRSLWLSSVTSFTLTIDGEEIPAGDLSLELGGIRYALRTWPHKAKPSGTSRTTPSSSPKGPLPPPWAAGTRSSSSVS
ncbi:C-glycoside deglycosidase beta subunit domain-containing protein [Arthrobacter sp. MMS24-T111]